MNIIATADIHGDMETLNRFVETAENYDIAIIAGDIGGGPWIRGGIDVDFDIQANENEVRNIYNILHRIVTPIYIVPGNHDLGADWPTERNVINVQYTGIEIGQYNIVGFPFIEGETFIRWWAEWIEDIVDRNTIFVTHEPAYGPFGNCLIKRIVEQRNPLAHIFGHYHQYGGQVNQCFVNAAYPEFRRFFDIDIQPGQNPIIRII